MSLDLDEDLLDIVRRIAGHPDPWVTTVEIADETPYVRRTVYNKLRDLVGDGLVATKQVGANGRGWWLTDDGYTLAHQLRLPTARTQTPPTSQSKADASPTPQPSRGVEDGDEWPAQETATPHAGPPRGDGGIDSDTKRSPDTAADAPHADEAEPSSTPDDTIDAGDTSGGDWDWRAATRYSVASPDVQAAIDALEPAGTHAEQIQRRKAIAEVYARIQAAPDGLSKQELLPVFDSMPAGYTSQDAWWGMIREGLTTLELVTRDGHDWHTTN